jgi:hypothetical protein
MAEERVVREGEHVPPMWQARAYHCPYCRVLAQMTWRQQVPDPSGSTSGVMAMLASTTSMLWTAGCSNCRATQVWLQNDLTGRAGVMIHPRIEGGPNPHVDMPSDVKADYEEARAIVQSSPRGACALLRLAAEKLVQQLQPSGGSLNDRIGKLVEAGMSPRIQQALDALRVIGNEAVHPGELDLHDDAPTAASLFGFINLIIEQEIATPKHVAAVYDALPEAKRAAIEERDGAAPEGAPSS